jgi:hypothetical protein
MRNRVTSGIRLFNRLALLGAVSLTMAAVHGAAMKSSQSGVEAGKELPLEGTGFHGGQTVTLVLLGTLTEYTLRDVTVDDAGTFVLDIAVPADVRPGQYQLLALSGEEKDVREAQMDLSVMAAQVATAAETHADAPAGAVEHAESMDVAARADEMTIARATTGAGWGVIGLMVGLAGGAGAVLLRGTPAVES